MQADDFKQILGMDIPNALEAIQKLERGVAPIMARVEKHRSEIDPSMLTKFDEVLNDLDEARKKLKDNGTFDS